MSVVNSLTDAFQTAECPRGHSLIIYSHEERRKELLYVYIDQPLMVWRIYTFLGQFICTRIVTPMYGMTRLIEIPARRLFSPDERSYLVHFLWFVQ